MSCQGHKFECETSKVLWSGVLLEEAYRRGSTQSQVLRGAMELGLPSRSTGHDFLERSRETKRLDHERKVSQARHASRLCLKNTRIQTLEGNHLESIGRIRTVPVERQSTSREHSTAT